MSNTKNVTPGRIALVVSAIAFVVYLLTMNQTFGFIDKGELVAVASTGGISHPTGYPTIMLLGYLVTKILPMRDVLALNILSALLAALGVGVLTLLFNDILGRISSATSARIDQKQRKGKRKSSTSGVVASVEEGGTVRIVMAGLVALSVGFTNTWWDQANGFEVYSLHAVMMPLVVLLFLQWCDSERKLFATDRSGSKGSDANVGLIQFTRAGFWFAFAVGLSFTNHLTTVLLAPALLVYYFWFSRGDEERSGIGIVGALRRLLVLLPPFLLGLLPYLWLPIRSSMKPAFNWGDPTSLGRLIDHITGKVYHNLFNSGGEVFSQQSSYFFGNLAPGLGYVGVALVVLGMIYLFGRQRRLAVLASLLFIVCIIWSGNYKISEIGPYYMTAILGLGIFAAAGLTYLYERLGRIPAVAIGSLVVALTLVMNWSVSNESNNTVVEDMTRDIIENVPQNSVVFAGTWDNWVTGSFYLQGVERLRPDVIVVDAELLGWDWYLDQLARDHPEFMATVKTQADAVHRAINQLENDPSNDKRGITVAHGNIFKAMIDSNITKRPVFVGPELLEKIRGGYSRVPSYLLFRLVTDSSYLPEKFPAYRFTRQPATAKINKYIAEIHQLYAQSAYDRAIYEHTNGHDTLAMLYYNYALGFDPGYRVQDIPSLPLDDDKHVHEVIDFFDQLRTARGGQTR